MNQLTKPTVRMLLALSVVTFILISAFTNCSNFSPTKLVDPNSAASAPGSGTGDSASQIPNEPQPTPSPSPTATPTASPTATPQPPATPPQTPASNFSVTPAVLNLDLAQVGEVVISGGLPPYNFTGAGVATISGPGPVTLWSNVKSGNQVFTITDAAGSVQSVTLKVRGEVGSLYAYFDEKKIGDLYYRIFGYTTDRNVATAHQFLAPGLNFPILVGEQMANTHPIYWCEHVDGSFLTADPNCGSQPGALPATKLGYMYSGPNAVPGQVLIKQIRLYDPVSRSRAVQAGSVEVGAGWIEEGVLGYRPAFVPQEWCDVRVPCK